MWWLPQQEHSCVSANQSGYNAKNEFTVQVQQRHMAGLPQLPVECSRLSRRRLREMLQLLLELVRSIERVEGLVSAGAQVGPTFSMYRAFRSASSLD